MKKNLKLATQIIPAVALLLLAAFGLQHSAPVFPPITTTAAAAEVDPAEQTAPVKPEKKQGDTTAAETANTVTPGTGDYQDGTFTGTGNGFHGPVKVQVTVKDKQITDITVLSNQDDAQFFNKAKEGIIPNILTAQTWEVDSVSGASYSSRGIKEAVQNALTGAVSSSTSPGAAAAGPVQLAAVTPGTGNYADGVHTGTGTGFRGPVTVKVTVQNRQITDVSVVSFKDDASFFNRARALIASIKTAQTWNVDSVSGASYSSRGIKEAVRNALTGATSTSSTAAAASASANKKKPSSSAFTTPAGGYKDGTYYGTATGFGGPVKTRVVIKNGKITSVSVVSASKETGSYLNRAKAITKRIVSKQSPNVDTVSGATYSSTAIREGVKKALRQAAGKKTSSDDSKKEDDSKKDETEMPTAPSGKKLSGSYKNGTYTGTADGFGGDITVKVTVKDNVITKIAVTKAAKETPSFLSKAKDKVIPLIITKQTTKVDGASGATYSSNGIKNAVAAALNKAKSGGSTTDDSKKEEDDSKKEEKPVSTDQKLSGTHQNGTYVGTGKGFAGDLKVKVYIKNNRIIKLEMGDNGETDSFLNKAMDKVFAAILSKQTTDVDGAAGATRSSNGIKSAVANALKKAESGDTSDDSKQSEGEKKDDEKKDDETKDEDEKKDNDEKKDDDKKDEDEKKDDEKEDDEKKDDDKKDEDEKKDDEEQKEEKKRSGTYTGTGTVNPDKNKDFSKYTLTIRVKFADGKVSSIGNLTIKGADSDEWDDDEYFCKMASDKMFSQLKSKEKADTVSGATCSSKAILEAFQDACKQADKELEG